MIRRILSKLLWLANSDPPCSRKRFYAMKDVILKLWGEPDGYDVQRIVKACWGDRWWDDEGDEANGCGPGCRRCGGTGVWEEKFIRLERWKLAGRNFHSNPTRISRPDKSGETAYGPVTIDGRIGHKRPGRIADEAMLWLALLTGHWRLLWIETAHVYRYGRTWFPLLNLACLAWFAARLYGRVKRQRCHCGQTYRQWFSSGGWCVCRECRKAQSPIPF